MRISDWSSDVCSSDLLELLVRRFNAAADAQVAQDPSRAVFRADLGADGWMIEKDVYAALVDPGDVRDIDAAGLHVRSRRNLQIGRASCRERVCHSVSISVFAVSLKKKKNTKKK